MRRGDETRYSLSAALTRLSSEVLRSVERSRAAASRSDDIFTARFAICPFPVRVHSTLSERGSRARADCPLFASDSGYCRYWFWLRRVFRLVHMLTNELNHVSGALDAGEPRIKD